MRMRQSEERFRGVGAGNGRTARGRAKLGVAIFSNRRTRSVCVALLGAAFGFGGWAAFDAASVRAADEPTVAANVSATTPDAFEYRIEEGFVTIAGLREEFRTATAVSVPKQIGMGTVKKIAPNAFQDCERLETVVLADATALDEIGERAFAGCSALKSVDFGKSGVGVIGGWAFSECSALTAVELPPSVRVIETGAFSLCSSLATFSGGDGVEEIAPAAFGGCAALETVVIGPNVQKIGSGAFRGCKRLQNFVLSASGNVAFKTVDGLLTSADGKTLVACPNGRGGEIVVPEGVVEIGPGAFMMGALESVVLPQTLKKIDANAFYSCDALKSVVGAPKALETIGVEAFADCDALERFDWPENLQTIEKQAFRGCGALTTANVKSVRTIGANAFYRCAKLETLELPSVTREIGAFAFAETGLKTFKAPRDLAVWNPGTTEGTPVEKFEVEEGNAAFQSVDGALLSKDGKTLYQRPQDASETSWKVPDGVRVVAERALSGAASLVSLEIPEGVETIGAGALRGCSALKKIAIPASLRQIDETFDDCLALAAFEVAEASATFSAVDGSLLSKDGKTLYRMARNTEADAAPAETFFVVGGPGPFATRVVPKGVERIAKGAFGNDRRVKNVEFPATVKQIDAGAFGNCPNVRSISVPASVEQLDERFYDCSCLAAFEVDPANPTYKSDDGALLSKDGKTFYRLIVRSEDYRKNATLEEGDHRKKYRYVVPEGVETIKQGAFAGAYRMSEIVFPQSLRTIETWAFNGSPLIQSVVIPAGVQTIEDRAFGGCDLREVVLESKDATFGKSAFLMSNLNAGELTIRVADKTLERKIENIEAQLVAEIAASKTAERKSDANEPTEPTVAADFATLAPTPETAFEYAKEPGGATITGVREAGRTSTTLYIPKKIGGSPVRKIAPNAFAGLDRLEALYVDTFIGEIGERAFADCVALKTVRFCSSESTVGPEAFAGCSALETFDVAGVYRIGAGAFAGCRNLAAFENSAPQNSLWKIVDGLILSQDGRTLIACPGGKTGEVVVPDGVVSIASGAFAGGAVESVVLPQTLEAIGEKAFANCDALKSVVGAPKALDTIRTEAFARCVALERFDWPENLQVVEKQAFQGCASLKSAAIESVRKIGERAFSGCSKLATLELSSETREIGAFAFDGTALTSFRLPRDLETLTAWALDGLALESVAVEEGNRAFKIVDGAVLSADGKTLYYRPSNAPGTSWKIPEGVRVVVRGALDDNASLVAVEIPEGVEIIGSGAFSGCLALQKLAIPASTKRIDDRFLGCDALETFEVAEGNPAYRSVDGALLSKDGKTLYRIAREGGAGTTKTVAYWNGREVKRVIPEGVERIATGAVGDDRLMTSVEIPTSVKRIDAEAFGVCDRLKSLTIPASVERLDERFEGCDALAEFAVASGNRNYTSVDGALLSKDFKTFYSLVGKGVWTRPNTLAPNYVYEYRVPSHVQTIKTNAFGGAWQMRKVILPQNLRTIERSAFSGATSLTSVTIPAGVEKIEKGAFVGTPLREVVLESSSATFDKSAFTENPSELTIRVAEETLEREKAEAEAQKAAEEAKKAAEKNAQETFQWEVSAGGKATITGVRDKTATSLDIPETLDGAPVTDIGMDACSNLPRLKTVRIGANVERINGAFRNCVNLESVEFPPASDGSGESRLHAILNGGFEGCSSLKKFAAPVSLVSLFPRSFSGCSALETVELSPRTREIGQSAFRNCSALREINIPESDGDLYIADSAFNGCDALTSFDAPRQLCGLSPNAFGELERPFQFKLHPDSKALRNVNGMILSRDGKTICAYFGPKTGELVIPEGVERVGQAFGSIFKGADFETIRLPKSLRVIYRQAFMLSKSLKRVELPPDSALEEIGDSAFRGCEALESFTWPKTLKTIGNSAFSRCRLKEFVGGPALEKIDAYAFSDCESLTKIELPSGLREIGNGAFSECGATSIKIPASVQIVGETAFAMGALEKFEVEEGSETLKVVDGALLTKDGKSLHRVPAALKLKSYKIPDGVEIIERAALGGNVTLETVEIPATVKTIGPNAFYRCVALKKLSIPASVEKMDGAFNRCDGLEQFEVDPKNPVYKSENGALLSADGKTLYAILAVERDAEAEAKAVAEVAATEGVDAETPKPIYKNPVYRVPDGVETIASYAFSDEVGMRNAFAEIVLPESVKEIGGGAFARCVRLEKAFIPKNVAKINGGAFKYCDALKTVEISPENPNYRLENGLLLSKDGKTFYEAIVDCGETVLKIPEGVERIAKTWVWSAFESGPTYTEVVLPETLTTLGEGSFNNWENLTSITIPKNVKKIEARAFSNCPNLAEVVLQSRDTLADAEAFYNFPEGPKPKIRVEDDDAAEDQVAEAPETSQTLQNSELKANQAAVDVSDALEWREVRQDEVWILGVRDKKATSVVIPETLGGAPVKAIAYQVFAGMRELKTVRLPKYLETIEPAAFDGCVKLENIEFAKDENGAVASNLQRIKALAFRGCVSLKSFAAPDSLVEIDGSAFFGCSALETATGGKNLEKIAAGAFADCVALKRVDCTSCEKLTQIENNAFGNCGALSTFDAPKSLRLVAGAAFGKRTTPFNFNVHPESEFLKTVGACLVTKPDNRLIAYFGERSGELVVPDGVEEIGPEVFSGAGFETVRFPKSLRRVNDFAFVSCNALKSVEIPEDSALESIGRRSFIYCDALETFAWPKSLKQIGEYAFDGCASLKSLTGATSLECVDAFAFSNCKALATVELPNGLREIGMGAFLNDGFASLKIPASVKVLGAAGVACTGLEKIEVEEGNEILKVVDGALLSKDGKTLHRLPPALKTTSYKIPDGVEIVGRSALDGNVTLETVELPASVTTIQRDAFYRCERLKAIAIPAKTEQIDKDAFVFCDALERFEVDPDNAVYKSENGALLSKDGKTFYGVVAVERDPSAEPLVVEPKNEGEEPRSVAAYKSYVYRVPNGVTTISNNAFYDSRRTRNAFKEIVLPEGLIVVGANVFNTCERLETIRVPASVTHLGSWTTVWSPDSTPSAPFPQFVFASNRALKTFEVAPESKTYRSEDGMLLSANGKICYAVCANKDRSVWKVPNGVVRLASASTKATEIVLPESLERISANTFLDCENLTSITIPKNVRQIEAEAFYNCPRLAEVVLKSSDTVYFPNSFVKVAPNLTIRVDENDAPTAPDDATPDSAKENAESPATFKYKPSHTKNAWITGVNNKNATALEIPETIGGLRVATIDANAFAEMRELRSVRIPASVETIRSGAFRDCVKLEKIEFAKSADGKIASALKTVEMNAFAGCRALKSFEAPDSLVGIGICAFAGCSALETVSLGQDVAVVDALAFKGCASLRRVDLSKTKKLKNFNAELFGETTAELEIVFPVDHPSFTSDGFLLSQDGKRINAYLGKRSGEIAIPEGVESIENGFFRMYAEVETIRLPKSLRFIGASAFYRCESLKNVVIPEDSALETIGDLAFTECCALERFDWPKSLKTIGLSAFTSCRSLKSFAGTTSLEKIGSWAFCDCESLTEIELPSGLVEIGPSAFAECGFTSIKIPASVRVMGDAALAITPLKTIEVEEGNEALKVVDGALLSKDGKSFFRLPPALKLKDFKIPEGVEIIERAALGGNETLESVEIPASVTTIEHNAFYRNSSLTEIVIPSGVKTLEDAFPLCDALERFEVDPKNLVYKSENGALLSKNGKTFYRIVAVERDPNAAPITLEADENLSKATKRDETSRSIPAYKNDVYVVPDGVATLEANAFSDVRRTRNAFTEIVLPQSLERIKARAFQYCSRLETLRIPANVASVGDCAFLGCDALKTFEVAPENRVLSAKDGMLLSDGGKMFCCVVADQGRRVLKLPEGVERAQSNALAPKKFAELVLPESLIEIKSRAFVNCENLTSVTIPKNVRFIGVLAFGNSPKLEKIVLKSSATKREPNAFQDVAPNCRIRVEEEAAPRNNVELKPEDATTSEEAAKVFEFVFEGNEATITRLRARGRRSLRIPEKIDDKTVTKIGPGAFTNTTFMESVELPPTLREIGSEAFAGCLRLGSVSPLPASLETLASDAFIASPELTALAVAPENKAFQSVGGVLLSKDGRTLCVYPAGKKDARYQVPDGVETIASDAFSRNAFLETVAFPWTLKAVKSQAFMSCQKLAEIRFFPVVNLLELIGERAFYNCNSLESINLPDGIRSIATQAFGGNALETVEFYPVDVEAKPGMTIASGAFDAPSLKSFEFPETLKSLANGAVKSGVRNPYFIGEYDESAQLVAILPPNPVGFELGAFSEMANLVEIRVDPACKRFKTVDGALLSADSRTFYFYPKTKRAAEFDVPNGVEHIVAGAFVDARVRKIRTPKTLKQVDAKAFGGSYLETLEFGEGARVVNPDAVWFCGGLTTLKLPSTLQNAERVVKGCALRSRKLANVEVASGNSALKTVDGLTLSADGKTLYFCSQEKGSGEVVVPDGVETIAAWAFARRSLESIRLPETLKRIEESAFAFCENLKSAPLPDGLEVVGERAFQSCGALSSISLPASVVAVERSAFASCDALKSIDVAAENPAYRNVDGVLLSKDGKTICAYPCGKDATEYVAPDGVEATAIFAFHGAKKLAKVVFPQGFKSQGFQTFYGCRSDLEVVRP